MTRRPLLIAVVAVLLCVLPFWWWWRCGPSTTLLIVRHADRETGADALSPAGLARAQELVHAAEKAGVAAIYRSNTNRTAQTAAPLAAALGLTPVVYPATSVGPLVDGIIADHPGQVVLVVGHSNTVPQIIEAAGGPALPNLDDDHFDDLFVLKACRCRWGAATLVNLQYGAISP